ncbi:HyaD/HybD family hydrogenase maturation endopeptidase [Thermosulfuriphilus sp.]
MSTKRSKEIKLALVGLGNLLLKDEGFGVHFVRHLERRYHFPRGVQLIDGGCAGFSLLNLIRGYEAVVIFDVLLDQAPPGTIKLLDEKALEALPPTSLASAHQVGIKDALALGRLSGLLPKHFWAYTVIPKEIAPGVGLSPEIEAAFVPLEKRLLELFKDLNISLAKRSPTCALEYP